MKGCADLTTNTAMTCIIETRGWMGCSPVLRESVQDDSPLGKIHHGVLEEVIKENLQGYLAQRSGVCHSRHTSLNSRPLLSYKVLMTEGVKIGTYGRNGFDEHDQSNVYHLGS